MLSAHIMSKQKDLNGAFGFTDRNKRTNKAEELLSQQIMLEG